MTHVALILHALSPRRTMATLRPPLDGFHPSSVGQQREVDVLRQLEMGLPADYTVFHGVCWSSVRDGVQWFGEIDAIVLAPNANLVLLEVKAGPVEVTPEGIRKRYGDRSKDIAQQTRIQHAALRQRLKDEGLHVYVAQLLVLPDQPVAGGSVNYPRERIVDAHDMPSLGSRVREAVPNAAPDASTVERVMRFLDDVFALAPDPTARIGWLGQAVAQLSEGLATWVPRLQVPGGRVRIDATAGSGKTQLALALLGQAAAQGLRAQYVCFNRPLAMQLRTHLPDTVEVVTFHELAIAAWRREHGEPDFGDSALFAQAEASLMTFPGDADLDVLVVDEMQDLDARWVDALLCRLKPTGRTYLLGDEDQRLFDARTAWNDSECVVLRCPDNFRSPRQIAATVQALGLCSQPITARCPLDGEVPGFHVWEQGDDAGMAKTEGVVRSLLADGVKPEHLAILSLRGLGSSRLLQEDAIAGLPLRKFTGYDPAGNALHSEGAMFADTVHRFKGQAAPVVVLTEMDFDRLDDRLRRRLFVGFTRAQWRLECVMSPRTESALAARLGGV